MQYMVRGDVHSGKCHSGNCPSGKCRFSGKLSVRGSFLWGTVRRETAGQANVFGELTIGEMSVGELSRYRKDKIKALRK